LLGTALISKDLKTKINEHCDFSGPDGTESFFCKELLERMSEQIGNVNLYDIYGECKGGATYGTKAPLGKHISIFSSLSDLGFRWKICATILTGFILKCGRTSSMY